MNKYEIALAALILAIVGGMLAAICGAAKQRQAEQQRIVERGPTAIEAATYETRVLNGYSFTVLRYDGHSYVSYSHGLVHSASCSCLSTNK